VLSRLLQETQNCNVTRVSNEMTLQRENVSASLNRRRRNSNFLRDKITSSCVFSLLPPLCLVKGTISSTFFPVAFLKIDTENDSSRPFISLAFFRISTSSSSSSTEVFPFYTRKLCRVPIIICKCNFVQSINKHFLDITIILRILCN